MCKKKEGEKKERRPKKKRGDKRGRRRRSCDWQVMQSALTEFATNDESDDGRTITCVPVLATRHNHLFTSCGVEDVVAQMLQVNVIEERESARERERESAREREIDVRAVNCVVSNERW